MPDVEDEYGQRWCEQCRTPCAANRRCRCCRLHGGRWEWHGAPAMFLTRGQAIQLDTRRALPAIDPLIEALEAAAAGRAPTQAQVEILTQTAKGFREVCRPEVPHFAHGAACLRCPAGADDLAVMDLGHDGNSHRTYLYLLRAGYTDCAQIAATPDAVLGKVFGLSLRRLEAIRVAVPYEGGGDD